MVIVYFIFVMPFSSFTVGWLAGNHILKIIINNFVVALSAGNTVMRWAGNEARNPWCVCAWGFGSHDFVRTLFTLRMFPYWEIFRFCSKRCLHGYSATLLNKNPWPAAYLFILRLSTIVQTNMRLGTKLPKVYFNKVSYFFSKKFWISKPAWKTTKR